MRYIIDHDYHLHSRLSLCSDHPDQTPQAILDYAVRCGLKKLVLTDHYWDAAVGGVENMDFYRIQDYDHIARALPLPVTGGVDYRFGCETDMDRFFRIGCPRERWDDFAFIIVPTSHLHMMGFTFEENQHNVEDKRELYVKRFEALLNADLPWGKVGLAHLSCSLIHNVNGQYLTILDTIPDGTWERLFDGCADVGCGIELNMDLQELADNRILPSVLRPYRIARSRGCKFYLGSDAHTPAGLARAMGRFNLMVDLLELEENEKFHIRGM